MPRSKSYQPEALLDGALAQFWRHGYCATSVDDLVRATGVSRHGLYDSHKGKQGLFLACFDHYQQQVVSPAFAQVEADGAGLGEIRRYFLQQIALAEDSGLPGPGCFVANSATEVAPHDDTVRACVQAHNRRLHQGFAQALRNSTSAGTDVDALAGMLVTFATGLWGLSRLTQEASVLRAHVDTMIDLLEGQLQCKA